MPTNYQPNFNDPRIQLRARRALGFALGVLNETRSHQWSTRYLDTYFGQQQNKLSGWLRSQLVIVTDEYWNKDTGVCKSYILNRTGAIELATLLEVKDFDKHQHIPYCITSQENIIKEWCRTEFSKELATKEFPYEEKSNRYWHPLQNVRSQYRREVLADADLTYQYDIECCAPTLIMYRAHQLGMSEYLFAMRSYLKRRTEIRAMISRDLEIPEEITKRIINALFCGARIARNKDSDIFQYLNEDPARLIALREHQYIQQLRKEIKLCWSYIEASAAYEKRYTITKKGNQKRQPMNSKRKWGVYFQLEQKVMAVVRTHLDITNNKYFLEHDGWTCQRAIDELAVEQAIKDLTGFTVKLNLDKQQHIPYCITSQKKGERNDNETKIFKNKSDGTP
jgi:hypothetical protein